MSAGAYGMVMSSNYNTRPRAGRGDGVGRAAHLVRERESVEQLFAAERIVALGCSLHDTPVRVTPSSAASPWSRGRGALAAYFSVDSRAQGKAGRQGSGRGAGVRRHRHAAERAGARCRRSATSSRSRPWRVKARVDGQIVAVNFREGQEVKQGRGSVPHRRAAVRGGAQAGRGERVARRGGARPGALAGAALPGAAGEEFRLARRPTRRSRPTRRPPRRSPRRARRRCENARLNLEYCTITSPIDGYVGKRAAAGRQPGQGERRRTRWS